MLDEFLRLGELGLTGLFAAQRAVLTAEGISGL